MRPKSTLAIIAGLACLILAVWLVTRNADPSTDLTSSAAQPRPADQSQSTKLDRHPSKNTAEHALPDHAASYWLVYPKSTLPVTVSKELALERIKQGLPRAQTAAGSTPLEQPLLGLPDAYDRLMSHVPFLGAIGPLIGIEHGDAYIFTQLRDDNPDDAFLLAWAIQKQDGNIYRWDPKN